MRTDDGEARFHGRIELGNTAGTTIERKRRKEEREKEAGAMGNTGTKRGTRRIRNARGTRFELTESHRVGRGNEVDVVDGGCRC